MQKINSKRALILAASLFFTSTLVQASYESSESSKGYQEVSYEDLLNEISAKKKSLQNERKGQNQNRLQAGVGYANSFTNIHASGQSYNHHATGIQLSLGMNLSSPNWFSEGVFRNYAQSNSGSEDFSLRELDLKIGYKSKLESIWSYTVSSGLSSRFLHFSDGAKSISVDSTTPALVISTGIMGQIHRNLSLGAEVGARSTLVNSSADKNSFDFALRLTTSL